MTDKNRVEFSILEVREPFLYRRSKTKKIEILDVTYDLKQLTYSSIPKCQEVVKQKNKMTAPPIDSVDEYIATFPKDVQFLLENIRTAILSVAPEAEESIAYGMPAYKTNSMPLVYFACFKKHIGFYATPSGHSQFSGELSSYKQGKGSVQFPLDKPIPIDLIRRIVAFRKEENALKKMPKK